MCTAIIDTSAIVWDENSFKSNPTPYYQLRESVVGLLDKIDQEQPIILLDENLKELIIDSFPFSMLPEKEFLEFGYRIYEFFSNVHSDRMVTLVKKEIGVTSSPNLIKSHFSHELQLEVGYTVNYIHNKHREQNVLFTFDFIWPPGATLTTKSYAKTHQCETVIADNLKTLENYFAQFKRVFVHSDKHHPGHEPGDYESPLSCYNGVDTQLPQKYLDEGLLVGKRYYNYDTLNKVYVVFFRTISNQYHGHDEHDRTKLPFEVVKAYNK